MIDIICIYMTGSNRYHHCLDQHNTITISLLHKKFGNKLRHYHRSYMRQIHVVVHIPIKIYLLCQYYSCCQILLVMLAYIKHVFPSQNSVSCVISHCKLVSLTNR